MKTTLIRIQQSVSNLVNNIEKASRRVLVFRLLDPAVSTTQLTGGHRPVSDRMSSNWAAPSATPATYNR